MLHTSPASSVSTVRIQACGTGAAFFFVWTCRDCCCSLRR